MSDIVGDLPPIGPGDGLPQVIEFLQKLRVYIQTREPQADSVGDALEKLLLRRDLVNLGALQVSSGGALSYTGGNGGGAGSGGTDDEPDLTAPPTPANLRASSLIRGAYIEIDPPAYTVGHGNAWTNYYVAQYGGSGPLPTFANAVKVGQAAGASTMYVHAAPIGAQLHIWAKHVTVDGVESAAPAGGTNGFQVTIGKIGNTDLGPLIVEAQNLANSAIPSKMGVAKFETITVRGTGLNGSNAGHGQMFINATHMGDTLGRGLTARVFNRATHIQTDDAKIWDTYAGATGGSYGPQVDMANYLNSLGADRVVMIASYDALSFDSPGDVLRLALKRLGASPAIDGAKGADRFQYAFIGIPGLGQGNGIEMLKPPTPGLPPAEAACFWLDNTILGSGSTINGMTLLTGDYFVDGAVQARHLAAGSIAVGTAAIAVGAILNAMIADATIDNAKIANVSASKLTAGRIAVGEYIASTNYSAGFAGWVIWGNGSAEFNNITVRNSTYTGTIYAGGGTIGGIRIDPSALANVGHVPGVSGFALFADGGAEFNQGCTFRGALDVGGNSGQRTKHTNAGVQVFNASNVDVIALGIF